MVWLPRQNQCKQDRKTQFVACLKPEVRLRRCEMRKIAPEDYHFRMLEHWERRRLHPRQGCQTTGNNAGGDSFFPTKSILSQPLRNCLCIEYRDTKYLYISPLSVSLVSLQVRQESFHGWHSVYATIFYDGFTSKFSLGPRRL